jgi:hypothetical protein
MADLTVILEAGVLLEVLKPTLGHYGKAFLERIQQLSGNSAQMIRDTGREPQPVPAKILLPLGQAACLEDDPMIFQMWEALLATAADPAQRVEVKPAFIDVLRQLTPVDALVLKTISLLPIIHPNGQLTSLNIPAEELCLSIENLLRLRLCRVFPGLEGQLTKLQEATPDADSIFAPHCLQNTDFGLAFIKACRPPAP